MLHYFCCLLPQELLVINDQVEVAQHFIKQQRSTSDAGAVGGVTTPRDPRPPYEPGDSPPAILQALQFLAESPDFQKLNQQAVGSLAHVQRAGQAQVRLLVPPPDLAMVQDLLQVMGVPLLSQVSSR